MPDNAASLDDSQSIKIIIVSSLCGKSVILRSSFDAKLVLVSSTEIVNYISHIRAIRVWNLNFYIKIWCGNHTYSFLNLRKWL